MKITDIELIEVDVPYIAPIRAVGHADWAHTIVKVRTDEGLTGLGETWQLAAAVQPQVDDWIGQDPLSVSLETAAEPWQCALYDIAAQARSVPVWRLLGDQIRDRVPVAYWSSWLPPEVTAKEAEQAAARGFTVHKLKARADDIVEQAEWMTKATAGAEYSIRVDPNCGFRHVSTAVRLAKELSPYDIECFEDPVEKTKVNHEWYRMLRYKTDIPQALHLIDPYDVLCAVKADAVDRFNISGNVAAVKRCAAIAEAAGCPIWLQFGGLCLGIQAAFSVHLQATLTNELLACDDLPFVRDNDLLGGSLQLDAGHFVVPEGPGLGVSLDEEAIAHYRTG
jgi:L-alanine-DL-glutamate epimerase-like enolase superfamily enzyme